jgi:hypothetical protein
MCRTRHVGRMGGPSWLLKLCGEIVPWLRTSAAQLYRLLDQTNYRDSVDQLIALLQVPTCDVDLVVRTKTV